MLGLLSAEQVYKTTKRWANYQIQFMSSGIMRLSYCESGLREKPHSGRCMRWRRLLTSLKAEVKEKEIVVTNDALYPSKACQALTFNSIKFCIYQFNPFISIFIGSRFLILKTSQTLSCFHLAYINPNTRKVLNSKKVYKIKCCYFSKAKTREENII